MYLPAAFREDRLETLHALIRTHPLGALITAGAGGLLANLVPFILVDGAENDGEEKGILRAHIARAHDQVEALRSGAETLVVFQGPEAYITPSWYAAKAEHARVVPTWNYVIVQARGTPRLIEDAAWIRAQIGELTASQENRRAEPWKVTDAPEPFIMGQIGAIVGVEIPIASIEGKWKVSQNRSAADRKGVIDGLKREGLKREGFGDEMASLVAERSPGPE
jgi:transcriptional regulator